MIGAIINAAGILAGGLCAFAFKKPMPARFQLAAKIILGVYTVWFGLQLTWHSLNGGVKQIFKELCLVLLAMVLGRLIGKALRLQPMSNAVGQFAARALGQKSRKQFSDGFVVATGLFCVGPVTFLASAQEGLADFSPMFIVKAVMDGLATMAFCTALGWGAMASALPVLALEGALIRAVRALEPTLRHQPWPLIDTINATNGLLIFCVALIILEVRKVRVTEYLPSLILAPLLTRWLW